MTHPEARVRWPAYLLFILAIAALLLSTLLFVHANRISQLEGEKMKATQSQRILSERLMAITADPDRRHELDETIRNFEDWKNANPAPEVDKAWQFFKINLPTQSTSDTDAALAGGPDFEPLRALSGTLSDWIARDEPEWRESASHLQQLASAIESKIDVADNGLADTTSARGAWLIYDQVLQRLESAWHEGELVGEQAATLLLELRSEYAELEPFFNADAGGANSIVSLRNNPDFQQSQSLLGIALDNQMAELTFAEDKQAYWFRAALLSALAAVALFFLVSFFLLRASRQFNAVAQQKDKKTQDSILRLLDEISALADGDLNTKATVSEDVTGAIADAINYAVAELRRLVSAITSSADRVTVAVEETGSSAEQLAKASSVQSREIQRSATYLSAMSDTMEHISQRSLEASQIASQSVEKSVNGRACVDRTVDGMERMRVQIQQSAGLLKRLDESSKQIGEIVGLVREVTGRSRLLALNSAIHSNSDAQQNHRFASIANEVQSLSATLQEAAQDIEALVNIIQDDVRSTSESMKLTIAVVLQGNELAAQAGDSLKDIETISRRLSVVVEHLAQKTRKQSDVVNQLSANMGVINDVTRRSAHGMQLSSAALEDLRHMVTELRDGVEDFVLPPAAQRFTQKDDMVGRPLLKKRELSPTATSNLGDLRGGAPNTVSQVADRLTTVDG